MDFNEGELVGRGVAGWPMHFNAKAPRSPMSKHTDNLFLVVLIIK
jgi:hypothetical protein